MRLARLNDKIIFKSQGCDDWIFVLDDPEAVEHMNRLILSDKEYLKYIAFSPETTNRMVNAMD